jgi:RNA polymerase sigma-70 factor (ECF subfamily)
MRLSIPIPFEAADCGPSLARGGAERASPQRMDEAAFHVFYSDTAPTLRSYIRRASGDTSIADDIVQEAFFRFLRADLPTMEKFQRKAYLYRTATTLLSDHWRRLKRERRWSLSNFYGGDIPANARPGGDAMTVFQGLKPQEQSLLWLAYVEGFDHGEIGSALQLREKSVRVLLFRARKKLAGLLRKRGLGREEGL